MTAFKNTKFGKAMNNWGWDTISTVGALGLTAATAGAASPLAAAALAGGSSAGLSLLTRAGKRATGGVSGKEFFNDDYLKQLALTTTLSAGTAGTMGAIANGKAAKDIASGVGENVIQDVNAVNNLNVAGRTVKDVQNVTSKYSTREMSNRVGDMLVSEGNPNIVTENVSNIPKPLNRIEPKITFSNPVKPVEATPFPSEIVPKNKDILKNMPKSLNKNKPLESLGLMASKDATAYEKMMVRTNQANMLKAGMDIYGSIRSINNISNMEVPTISPTLAKTPEPVNMDYGAARRSMEQDAEEDAAYASRQARDIGVNSSTEMAALLMGNRNKINAAITEQMYRDEALNAQLKAQTEMQNAQLATNASSVNAQLSAAFNQMRGQMETESAATLMNAIPSAIGASAQSKANMYQRLDDLRNIYNTTASKEQRDKIAKDIAELEKMLSITTP